MDNDSRRNFSSKNSKNNSKERKQQSIIHKSVNSHPNKIKSLSNSKEHKQKSPPCVPKIKLHSIKSPRNRNNYLQQKISEKDTNLKTETTYLDRRDITTINKYNESCK